MRCQLQGFHSEGVEVVLQFVSETDGEIFEIDTEFESLYEIYTLLRARIQISNPIGLVVNINKISREIHVDDDQTFNLKETVN